MKPIGLLFFLLPLLAAAQVEPDCRPLKQFWTVGTTATFPRSGGTAVGVHFSRNTVLVSDGLFLGGSADVIKFTDKPSLYLPLSVNFTWLPLNKAIGPVVEVAPGYGFYSQASTDEKTQWTNGGLTFYGGAGIALSNALITAGYSRYGFQTHAAHQAVAGFGFRVAMIL